MWRKLPVFIGRKDVELIKLTALLGLLTVFAFVFWQMLDQTIRLEERIIGDYKNLEQKYVAIQSDYSMAQFESRLALQAGHVVANIEQSETDRSTRLNQIGRIYDLYQNVLIQIERNQKLGIDETTTIESMQTWGEKLINQQFDNLETEMKTAMVELDTRYYDAYGGS